MFFKPAPCAVENLNPAFGSVFHETDNEFAVQQRAFTFPDPGIMTVFGQPDEITISNPGPMKSKISRRRQPLQFLRIKDVLKFFPFKFKYVFVCFLDSFKGYELKLGLHERSHVIRQIVIQ